MIQHCWTSQQWHPAPNLIMTIGMAFVDRKRFMTVFLAYLVEVWISMLKALVLAVARLRTPLAIW